MMAKDSSAMGAAVVVARRLKMEHEVAIGEKKLLDWNPVPIVEAPDACDLPIVSFAPRGDSAVGDTNDAGEAQEHRPRLRHEGSQEG